MTGQLLHKTDPDVPECFGPFTAVNGTIWPYIEVEPDHVPVPGCSTARTPALFVSCSSRGQARPSADRPDRQRGRAAPRAGANPGARTRPRVGGTRRPSGRLLRPCAGDGAHACGTRPERRSTARSPTRRPRPTAISRAFSLSRCAPIARHRRASLHLFGPIDPRDRLSADARGRPGRLCRARDRARRATREVDGQAPMLTLRELVEDPFGGEPVITVVEARGGEERTSRWRTVATRFEDAATFFPVLHEPEIWRLINLTEDTHPIHVHPNDSFRCWPAPGGRGACRRRDHPDWNERDRPYRTHIDDRIFPCARRQRARPQGHRPRETRMRSSTSRCASRAMRPILYTATSFEHGSHDASIVIHARGADAIHRAWIMATGRGHGPA